MPRLYFRKFRSRRIYANVGAFRRVIAAGFRAEIAPPLVKLHLEQIAHWKKRPPFEAAHEVTPAGVAVEIIPQGPLARLWYWHTFGVKGRIIQPRRHRAVGRALRPTGRPAGHRTGRPKRAALRFIGSSGDVVYARRVKWKGIRARRYPQRVAQAFRPQFYKIMENIVRRAVRAAQREGT